jgi:hypothetical protein
VFRKAVYRLMRKKRIKLVYSIMDIPEKARKLIAKGGCIDDDPYHLWADVVSTIDQIRGGTCPGVHLAKGDLDYVLSDIPEAWWTLMGFPAEMEKGMREHWAADPENAVEWEWD